ncbi:hypothetical protein EJ05DRAFT_29300 [Pseudovirgaria hyperparasitica]|uniref:Uncharacterized protein n=1 Tax=Pseudovirgaria hyperparasitica TaxID=470096 RepID=A0A6A6WM26_9PEZI|nr:uncharacterized protein EJ05DRAFT_29300 [Pseudovirgaria hyperparasitica]KAF2763196.1 hypothetical protein EJ05DRAFT_29300 [Pseudovirgaria hyperparasitica]
MSVVVQKQCLEPPGPGQLRLMLLKSKYQQIFLLSRLKLSLRTMVSIAPFTQISIGSCIRQGKVVSVDPRRLPIALRVRPVRQTTPGSFDGILLLGAEPEVFAACPCVDTLLDSHTVKSCGSGGVEVGKTLDDRGAGGIEREMVDSGLEVERKWWKATGLTGTRLGGWKRGGGCCNSSE